MSAVAVDQLTLAQAMRMIREATKDKRYQLFPLGEDVADYMRHKRKRLTAGSEHAYEATLRQLVLVHGDLRVEDFEPPIGTRRIEEFMDNQWGGLAPGSYNRNLSILRDFFKWAILRGRLHGDPTLAIERARKRDIHREVFSRSDMRRVLAENPDTRDRLCLRLLLDYGLRKGALRAVQFKHFDHARKKLTVFTKGGKVRNLPIPHAEFWNDLGILIIESDAKPSDYLLCSRRTIPNKVGVRLFPDKPLSSTAAHRWWYRCLENAGIVPVGTQKGERMHKARHTAGQRVLDATGNLKAAQKLLGHASIQTTADVYTDWDDEALAATMLQVLREEDE